MRKRMIIMLACVLSILLVVFGLQVAKIYFTEKYFASMANKQFTVSATTLGYEDWNSLLTATGSLRAVHGVEVTTEVAGLIEAIYFTPGQEVNAGDILVQLNADNEIATLHSQQALAELAQVNYERDKAQYEINAVSKEVVDTDAANLRSQKALVEQQAALVAKKTIRAPFSGKLGINQVNLGQYLNTGNPIVTLQSLDPIYIDFYVPEQQLVELEIGHEVSVTTDTFPGQVFKGKITTINPSVDTNTRNIQIEATLPNPKEELLPGMFARVSVLTGKPRRFLTLPQSAVSYNSYGNIVYVIEEQGKDPSGEPQLIAKQKFIELGETRGDQVQVTKGLKEGDKIVTSGQMKLKNNALVTINNSVVPSNNPNPNVVDE